MIRRRIRILTCLIALSVVTCGSSCAEMHLKIDDVLKEENLMPKGTWVERTVPDTLDLAERGLSSISVLTHNVLPHRGYYVWSANIDGNQWSNTGTWDITPKNARTLPMLRTMCGTDYNVDVEYNIMRALMSEVREDGLQYYPYNCNKKGGTSYPQTNALTMMAMLNYHSMDGNPLWLEWVDHMAKGLRRVPVQVEDRAFFPMQCGIDPDGVWHLTDPDGVEPYNIGDPQPYIPTMEPAGDSEGYEGAARAEANRAMSMLLRHYAMTGEEESREIAEKILRFILKPGIWDKNIDEKRYPGYEHGIWSGHFHNGTQGLNALIDAAMILKSDWLKEFAREYYEHTRRNGVVRMGWFPCWSSLETHGAGLNLGEITEPCSNGDWVVDAVRMSDAGLGDYWDDVDYNVRNHLTEQNICDFDGYRKYLGLVEGSTREAMLKTVLGGFLHGTPTRIHAEKRYEAPACCTVNGAQGLYYAWHGITRFDKGVATVNLFLNRVSPWMDVDSHLPYEGKVVLYNKQANTAIVRIPSWTELDKVECTISSASGKEKRVDPPRFGNRLIIQGLKKGDKITLEFPVPKSTDQYTINEIKYTIKFKGSTVIDISPRDEGDYYQLYQRDHYMADKAPTRTVKRFVAEKVVPLGAY